MKQIIVGAKTEIFQVQEPHTGAAEMLAQTHYWSGHSDIIN